MARIEGVSMYFKLPPEAVRPDLLQRFPQGTSTLELIRRGLRTSTTRRPFARPGDVISFERDADPYEVISVARPDLVSPAGRQAWEQHEGWNLGYIDANPSLRAQVYNPSAVQTIFRPVAQPSTRMAGSVLALPPQGDIWAFGGARATPQPALDLMAEIGRMHVLLNNGRIIHGGAPGADRAATRLVSDPNAISVYLNGPSDLRGPDPMVVGGRVYNAREMPGWRRALEIAPQFEDPYRPGGRSYNARNVMVLLGRNADPEEAAVQRKRLVVWTPGGRENSGVGTPHIIRGANHYGIPVFNIGAPAVRSAAEEWLESGRRYLGLT